MAARGSVLVTGAYGLVGRPTVERLVADGFKVIVTAHHTVKPAFPAAVDVRSVDLTKPDQIAALVAEVSPSAIVHLAAVIPPMCYANRALARAVNVDATATLVRAASTLPIRTSVRARVERCRTRQPEPVPVFRPARRRQSAGGVGSVQLSQDPCREHRADIESGVVDPSARWRPHPRTVGRLRRFRFLLFRCGDTRRQPHPQR